MKVLPGFSFFYKKEEKYVVDGFIETDDLDRDCVEWHWNDGEDGPSMAGEDNLPTISLGAKSSKLSSSFYDEESGEYRDISHFVSEAAETGFAIAFPSNCENIINSDDIYYGLAVTDNCVLPLPFIEKAAGVEFPTYHSNAYEVFQKWCLKHLRECAGVAYACGPDLQGNKRRAVKFAREFLGNNAG